MSDESQPPALRLKPRLRVDNEPAPTGPAAPVAPATETTGGGTGAESVNPLPPAPAPLSTVPAPPAASGEKPAGIASTEPCVRLKPRLAVNSQPAQPAASAEATSMPAAPSGEIPAPSAAVAAAPVEPPPPMAAPAPEAAARFKLKPKVPVPVPAGIVTPPIPATGAAGLPPVTAATLPPPPSLVPALVAAPLPPVEALPPAKLSGASHVPHIRAPGEEMPLPKAPPPPVAPPKRPRISKPSLIAVMVAGVLVLAAYFALRIFAPSPPPPPLASKVATKPQALQNVVAPKPAAATPALPGPTPSATLNQIAAAPKQAIDKAKDVVAARRGNEQARIDAMAAGEEAPDKRALDTPPPSRFSGQPPSPDAAAAPAPLPGSGSLIAPGVTATTNDVVAAPKASAAFKRFVADARITGVFQGTPPRALINGRMIRAGEVVDKALGVVFDSIDAEKKTITFKDRAGIPATRKY